MKVITGTHAIEEALKVNSLPGAVLYLKKGADDKNASTIKKLENLALACSGVAVKKVSLDILEKLSPSHRGAVLALSGKSSKSEGGRETTVQEFCKDKKACKNLMVLALDSITDPHNVGAILRSCDCFKVDLVLLPKNRSANVNETVMRVSSGAANYVNIAYSSNLVRDLKYLKDNGFWVYGCDMGNDSIANIKYSPRSIFVLGREGEGLHSLVKSECDHIVSIPIYGHVDSLNVSVAAGIFMNDYRLKNPL